MGFVNYRNGNYVVYFNTDNGDKIRNTHDDKFIPAFAENCDVTRTSLGVNADYDASSLSYFVIQKNRIVASGNLKKDENDNYVCDGAFRVFSKVNVSTHEYVLAGQVDVSELDRLNVAMIDSTEKKTRSLK